MPSTLDGATLNGTVPYSALPTVRPAEQPMGVLGGLPNGPFSISTAAFPLSVLRACRSGTDCASAVTAVPAPADGEAVAATITVTATSHIFPDFDFLKVNGVSRDFLARRDCNADDVCREADVQVLFQDITAPGTLMLANTHTQGPGIGTLTVRNAVQITAASSLGGGTVGVAYSKTITATGGSNAKSWATTAGSLPAGLSLDGSTGALTGDRRPRGPPASPSR
jgi:hypothetical protein